MQPPAEFISMALYSQNGLKWIFRDYTKERLIQLFNSAGLSESQRGGLQISVESSNTCVVIPNDDVIFGMSPSARAQIYAVLGTNPENAIQYDPFVYKPAQINEWLAHSALPAQTIAMVKALLYEQGDSLLFADYGAVLKRLASNDEKTMLLKTLLRKQSLLVKVRITPETDIDALLHYWGKGGDDKVVRPLLEGLPRIEGGLTIGLPRLLPAFAFDRLYTYPLPSDNPAAGLHDCHWTTFNFFNEHPGEGFANAEQLKALLQSDYYPVSGTPAYGDAVLFVTSAGKLVHSAVYLADDILFTKNGASPISPWMLMRLPELLSTFQIHGTLKPLYYRFKKY